MSVSFFTSQRLQVNKDTMTHLEYLLGNIASIRPAVGIGGCSEI